MDMKMKQLNWLVLCLPLWLACTGNKLQKDIVKAETTVEADTIKGSPSSFYFAGEFTYFADAATLHDCITGSTLPVAMKGQFPKVEKKYGELDPEPMQAIHCAVMGYLVDKEPDEEGPQKQLLITSLIGFDPSVKCNPEHQLTEAVYAHFTPNEEEPKTKTSIMMSTDYTYECTTYQLYPVKRLSRYTGHWYRMAKDNIVFLTDGDILYEGNIDFTNMNLILQNDNEKEVIFRRDI